MEEYEAQKMREKLKHEEDQRLQAEEKRMRANILRISQARRRQKSATSRLGAYGSPLRLSDLPQLPAPPPREHHAQLSRLMKSIRRGWYRSRRPKQGKARLRLPGLAAANLQTKIETSTASGSTSCSSRRTSAAGSTPTQPSASGRITPVPGTRPSTALNFYVRATPHPSIRSDRQVRKAELRLSEMLRAQDIWNSTFLDAEDLRSCAEAILRSQRVPVNAADTSYLVLRTLRDDNPYGRRHLFKKLLLEYLRDKLMAG
eukprot:scaffold3719_cov247-Pinguiococcus_pyrenoidosus.AAC.10